MRAADKTQLRLRVLVLPDDRIVILHALKLGVVNDVHLRALLDERYALLLRFRSQVLDMEQADRAVGGRRRAEVLQICTCLVVKLRAEPLVETSDIRHFLHDLHADRGAEQLRLGLMLTPDVDYPCGLAPLVGQQTEFRHEASDGAHQLDHAGVAVAARAEDRVCVHDGGAFRPAEHVALLGLVPHLINIAGAGIGVLIRNAELAELLLKAILLGVHYFLEHDVLKKACRHILIQRARIRGKLLTVGQPRVDEPVK